MIIVGGSLSTPVRSKNTFDGGQVRLRQHRHGVGCHRLQHLGRKAAIADDPLHCLAGLPFGLQLRIKRQYQPVADIEGFYISV